MVFEAWDERATRRLGVALAEVLPNGAVVALMGTLGAGKTRLVQAVAEGAGVPPGVAVSPTFVLVQEYHGARPVYHFDAYRIRDDDEFLELGADEYFDSEGITLVEWADRVPDCLPGERLDVRIELLSRSARRFHLRATGKAQRAALDQLARVLAPE
jgi:tRNA threonylcarbamoyladenosine biosynthesis protein TsaE